MTAVIGFDCFKPVFFVGKMDERDLRCLADKVFGISLSPEVSGSQVENGQSEGCIRGTPEATSPKKRKKRKWVDLGGKDVLPAADTRRAKRIIHNLNNRLRK